MGTPQDPIKRRRQKQRRAKKEAERRLAKLEKTAANAPKADRKAG